MIYAVLKLKDELADQLELKKSLENKPPRTETVGQMIIITDRRIKELEEALKVLQPVSC